MRLCARCCDARLHPCYHATDRSYEGPATPGGALLGTSDQRRSQLRSLRGMDYGTVYCIVAAGNQSDNRGAAVFFMIVLQPLDHHAADHRSVTKGIRSFVFTPLQSSAELGEAAVATF